MADQLGVLKIHYPLDREQTKTVRAHCHQAVIDCASTLRGSGTSSVLMTDHNTHGPLPNWGGRRLASHRIDYVGASTAAHGARLKVLKTKVVDGTIDNHEFIGVQTLVTWPSGLHSKIWFVQANFGRHESDAKFLDNARRLKKAFRGNVVWGFDEIDEKDVPNEHALLEKVWDPRKYHYAGGAAKSMVIASPRLRVKSVAVIRACGGVAHLTPARDLVRVIIQRPLRLRDRLKK
jgi:hypothetical protein